MSKKLLVLTVFTVLLGLVGSGEGEGSASQIGNGQITLQFDPSIPPADRVYIQTLFDTVYPELIRVYGRPSNTITVTVVDRDFCCMYDKESNTLQINTPLGIPAGQNDPIFDRIFTHELAHAFRDAIEVATYQRERGWSGFWIGEGTAEAAAQLVAWRLQGRRPLQLLLGDYLRNYDVYAQLGQELLNTACPICPHPNIPSYSSAAGLFLLLTFGLSPERLDFLARLNEQLYRNAERQGTTFTRARILEAVRAAASGKRIEGLEAVEWIERQPVAFEGLPALGPHLGVLPRAPEELKIIEVFAFTREWPADSAVPIDRGIGGLEVAVKVLGVDSNLVLQRTVRTSTEGDARLTLSSAEREALRPGAYQIVAEATYQGQRLVARSFALRTGLELAQLRETRYLLGATLNVQGLPVCAAVQPSAGQLVMQQKGAFIVEVPHGITELTLTSGSARRIALKPGPYARVVPFTVGPDAPTCVEIPFQLPQLLFQDDFSDPASGWSAWENDWGEVRYENGEYSILAKRGAGHRWGYAPSSLILNDFTLELEARHVDGPAGEYGVIFRYGEPRDPQDLGDFYLLSLTTRGEYALFKVLGRRLTPLVDYRFSAAIKRGPEWNRIRITAVGSQIRVAVNGQELLTVRDESLAGGRLILFVNAFEEQGGTHAHFDNVRILRE